VTKYQLSELTPAIVGFSYINVSQGSNSSSIKLNRAYLFVPVSAAEDVEEHVVTKTTTKVVEKSPAAAAGLSVVMVAA